MSLLGMIFLIAMLHCVLAPLVEAIGRRIKSKR